MIADPSDDGIEGVSLNVYLARGNWSIQERLELFEKICKAVQTVHLRGNSLRDLTPGTICIDGEGDSCIVDFDPAAQSVTAESIRNRQRANGPSAAVNEPHIVEGLRWLSPEEVTEPWKTIGIRANVYSLGVILYHLLTSRFPYYVVGSPQEVRDNILFAPPARPSSHRPDLSPKVDCMVLKCLHKAPDERYANAGELALDVRRCLDGHRLSAQRGRHTRVLSRLGWPRRAAALAVLTVGIGLAGYALLKLVRLLLVRLA